MEPVDLLPLAEQTAGDPKLEREVLVLFLDDSAVQLERLRSSSAEDRRMIAHRLLGSARAIGAHDVARHAAAIEAGGTDIAALAGAVERAARFIREHLSLV